MAKMKIRVGDTVRVIAGKDKGKEGKVVDIYTKTNRILVEGVNMSTKHSKPSAQNQNGGIIHQESPIDVSNVAYVHKGKITKIGFEVEEGTLKNGKKKSIKHRVAKATGERI